MKEISCSYLIAAALILLAAGPAPAQDVRHGRIEAREARARIEEAARREREQAASEAELASREILADKGRLQSAIRDMKAELSRLDEEAGSLKAEREGLERERAVLREEAALREAEARELTGFIRSAAKELDTRLLQSPQGAFGRGEDAGLARQIADKQRFPRMEDLAAMLSLLEQEIRHSGQVRMADMPVVGRDGKEHEARVLMAGNFTAAGRVGDEADFLIYSEPTRRFFQLSRPSPSGLRGGIAGYMDGKSEDFPVDLSRGAALRQLTHRLDWREQIKAGGPIVWPILFIALAALILIAERLVFLLRVRTNAEKLMSEVLDLARKQDWDACMAACEKKGKRPVPRVLAAGLACRGMSRQDMENVLAEAILREIPRLERFFPTIGMLAAISPLLGLLGTVTGMINTFHVITFAGTGDPRLMSGGISEALVTTMLGLAVAIPVMVAHTLLSRMVERIIAQMEEKSMALVNEIEGARRAA